MSAEELSTFTRLLQQSGLEDKMRRLEERVVQLEQQLLDSKVPRSPAKPGAAAAPVDISTPSNGNGKSDIKSMDHGFTSPDFSKIEYSTVVGWTEKQFTEQLRKLDLHQWGIRFGETIALMIPNGQKAALVLSASINRYCAVPFDPMAPAENIAAALRRIKPRCLLALAGPKAKDIGTQTGVPVIELQSHPDSELSAAGGWSLPPPPRGAPAAYRGPEREPNGPDSVVLVLQTSGTTSTPKLVTFTSLRLHECGCALAASMKLDESDVGLNVMPLHHVGGIACNLMAPMVSGGRMLFSVFGNAKTWFDKACNPDNKVTWSYAAPAIWSSLLKHCETNPVPAHTLRILRSGAASLPHADAQKLRSVVGHNGRTCVLPTYSMTECMPVCSPPLGYALEKPGSVGMPCNGLDLRIRSTKGEDAKLQPGEMGDIHLVSGPQLFIGYGKDQTFAPREVHFPTGDRGHADAEMWISLTGRAKEVINRGGELLSPFEIEEACADAAGQTVMAFSAPHTELGEIVALAVPKGTRATLTEIHRAAMKKLTMQALPQVLVVVDALPRTNGTGKLQRVGYAEKIGLPAFDDLERKTYHQQQGGKLRLVQ